MGEDIMKNQKGSVMLLTMMLMFFVTLITVASLSAIYYYHYRTVLDYRQVKERIETEVIAQEVYIKFQELFLQRDDAFDPENIDLIIDDETYKIQYDSDMRIFSYKVLKQFKKNTIIVQVEMDDTLKIIDWKVKRE
jgi:hypothetical protein